MVKQADFNLPQYLAQGHGDFGEGEMRNLDIKVSPDLAAYLAECKLTVNQKITPVKKPADWFRLTAQLPDTQQLKSWLLSQGDAVLVKG